MVFTVSKWDNFKKSVSNFADKAAKKTEELTDLASLKIKIANKESARDNEYKALGKLIYEKFKNTDETLDKEMAAGVAEHMKKLDDIFEELKNLNAEYNNIKKSKENSDKSENSEKSSQTKADGQDIMDQFNTAREQGDKDAKEADAQSADAKVYAEQMAKEDSVKTEQAEESAKQAANDAQKAADDLK